MRIDRPASFDDVLRGADLFDGPPQRDATSSFWPNPDNHLLFAYADIDDAVLGFVTGIEVGHPDKDTEMLLYELGVDEAHRRKGIGTALASALLASPERAVAWGCGWRSMQTTRPLTPPTAGPVRRRRRPASSTPGPSRAPEQRRHRHVLCSARQGGVPSRSARSARRPSAFPGLTGSTERRRSRR